MLKRSLPPALKQLHGRRKQRARRAERAHTTFCMTRWWGRALSTSKPCFLRLDQQLNFNSPFPRARRAALGEVSSAFWHSQEISGYHLHNKPKAVFTRLSNLPKIRRSSGQRWNGGYCSALSPFCSSRQTAGFSPSTGCHKHQGAGHPPLRSPLQERNKTLLTHHRGEKPGCVRVNDEPIYRLSAKLCLLEG